LKAKKKHSAADIYEELKLPGWLIKLLSKVVLAAGLTKTASFFRSSAVEWQLHCSQWCVAMRGLMCFVDRAPSVLVVGWYRMFIRLPLSCKNTNLLVTRWM
jgi:hypothetical protein